MPASAARLRDRIAYGARASKALALQPYEGVERTLERFAERRDERDGPWAYRASPDGEERVHGLLGLDWPCEELHEFDRVWRAATGELLSRGLQVGRGAFGGWDDGDVRLGRVAWCVARHLRAERIVETGVARGLTSRVLLEALQRNGSGHLWSVDLPPLTERNLSSETGAAVPETLNGSWSLLRGSSRRVLPRLTSRLGRLDMFVHDSMHTTRNLSFELDTVWSALAPGAAILIDDVEKNSATLRFLQRHPDAPAVIFPAADDDVLLGYLMKPAG